MISQKVSNQKVKECFAIATEWEKTGTNPEQPTKFNDTFALSEATTDEVNKYCNRVWSMEDITHAESTKLTKVVTTKPTTTAELDDIRNQLKLKHAMARAMVWDSLTATYQLDIVGD